MAKLIKWLQRAVVLAALLIVTAALIPIAIEFFSPAAKIQALVVKKAEKALGRQIRINGMSWSLWGLDLRDLTVSELPDFRAGTFATAELVRIRVSLRALWSRRELLASKVEAHSLDLKLRRAKDGKTNFDDLIEKFHALSGRAAESRPARAAGALALSMTGRRVLVRKARISFDDRLRRNSWLVSRLNADLSPRYGGTPSKIDIRSMHLRLPCTFWSGACGVPVEAHGRLSLTEGTLAVQSLEIGWNGKGARVKIEASRLLHPFSDSSAVDLNISAPRLFLEEIPFLWSPAAAYDPRGEAGIRLQVMGPLAHPSWRSDLTAKGASFKFGQARFSRLAGSMRLKIENRNFFSSGRARVAQFSTPELTLSDTDIQWKLSWPWTNPQLVQGSADLRAGKGRMLPLHDLAGRYPWLATLLMPFSIAQDVTRLGGISLFPDLEDVRLKSLAGSYVFSGGTMLVQKSSISSDLGNVAAAGKIDWLSKKLDMNVTAHVAKILPITVHAGGSIDHPQYSLSARTALAPVSGALDIIKKTLHILHF